MANLHTPDRAKGMQVRRVLGILGLLGLQAILAAGCNLPVPFTQELRNEYDLTEEQLRHIQYYVSGPLTLRRELATDEATVTPGHQVRIVKEHRVEEIIIGRGTPGIAERVTADSLDVSFEKGHHITFGCKTTDDDGKERSEGRYLLYAKGWQEDRGKVTYGGKTFYVVGSSGDVHLLVDLRKIKSSKKDTRRVKGRHFPKEKEGPPAGPDPKVPES